jgi:hypothetical protein
MHAKTSLQIGAVIILVALAGCDRLKGLGNATADAPDGAPGEQELSKINYMTADNSGVKGRRIFTHLEEAKTCGDLELAMRWNRPPNVAGGPFHQKMVYVTDRIPADLPQKSEVFISGRIEKWATLQSGGAGWMLRMKDGTPLQAIEQTNFWEKQEQESQSGKVVALVKPNEPGRILCGQGVYEGMAGRDIDQDKKIPLFSTLYVIDRKK